MARHYYTPYDLSSVNLSVHCAVTTHTVPSLLNERLREL